MPIHQGAWTISYTHTHYINVQVSKRQVQVYVKPKAAEGPCNLCPCMVEYIRFRYPVVPLSIAQVAGKVSRWDHSPLTCPQSLDTFVLGPGDTVCAGAIKKRRLEFVQLQMPANTEWQDRITNMWTLYHILIYSYWEFRFEIFVGYDMILLPSFLRGCVLVRLPIPFTKEQSPQGSQTRFRRPVRENR